mgnify:CR=1 FL=1
MARSIQEIYTELSNEASNYSELNELETNSSAMNFWHYGKLVFAYGSHQLEKLFDQLKEDIKAILHLDYSVGTVDWYKEVFKGFQYGDELKIKYNTPYYEVPDLTKQIIEKVSVKDISTGGLMVNVQKENAGEIIPLTTNELSAFTVYANRRKIAGTLLDIQSPSANILTLDAKVYLSKEVFEDTGANLITGAFDVLDALRAYVQFHDFDETIYLSSLYDDMNDITGVKAFHLTAATIDTNTISLADGKLELANGYGKITETDIQFNNRMTYELI